MESWANPFALLVYGLGCGWTLGMAMYFLVKSVAVRWIEWAFGG